MTPHDDPERDAWLTQALRHAPDADAAPPTELSDTILRAARNAVKTPQAAAPSPTNPLLRLWAWLVRPPVAAGFATVMVATLVGVMWWDKPLDETLPQAAAPAATVSAERGAAPPAAASTAPAAPEPAQAKAEERVENEAPRAAARSAPPRPAEPAQPARKRVADPPAAVAAVESPKRSADAAAPLAVAPSAFPAPAPAAAPAPATENAAKSSGAVARDARVEQRADREREPAKSAAPTAALSPLRQEATPVIDEPDRWSWQRGAGPRPMTPALQRWIAQLDRAARWRPAAGAPPTATAGNVLQLWRDGALHTTIQLGDDTVWITPVGGAPLMAPLAPAVAASLKTALADAAP